MTPPQLLTVVELAAEAHRRGHTRAAHGDCIGADAQFHRIARAFGFVVAGFPSNLEDKRAYCDFDTTNFPLPPLQRNRLIVNHVRLNGLRGFIAAPLTAHEQVRSGTWYTIRYAVEAGLAVQIVLPNGSIEIR